VGVNVGKESRASGSGPVFVVVALVFQQLSFSCSSDCRSGSTFNAIADRKVPSLADCGVLLWTPGLQCSRWERGRRGWAWHGRHTVHSIHDRDRGDDGFVENWIFSRSGVFRRPAERGSVVVSIIAGLEPCSA
jgi:hypothetical protein